MLLANRLHILFVEFDGCGHFGMYALMHFLPVYLQRGDQCIQQRALHVFSTVVQIECMKFLRWFPRDIGWRMLLRSKT